MRSIPAASPGLPLCAGGTGKTTLARAVFNELRPLGFSGNCSAYVEVALEGGSTAVARAREELLGQLGVASAKELPEARQKEELQSKLKRSSTPLLLVLDNVWTQRDLGGLLPCAPPPGSCVLLTSRNKNLHAQGGCSLFMMPGLEGDDAVQLFRSYALGDASARIPDALKVRTDDGMS